MAGDNTINYQLLTDSKDKAEEFLESYNEYNELLSDDTFSVTGSTWNTRQEDLKEVKESCDDITKIEQSTFSTPEDAIINGPNLGNN